MGTRSYTARCAWDRGGYEEVELVDVMALSHADARRKIETKILRDYQPGGRVMTVEETQPILTVYSSN